MDHELRVHTELPLRTGALKKRIVRIDRVEPAKSAHDAVRHKFDIAPGRNPLQPVERRGLSQPTLHSARHRRPECILVLAHDAAIQNDSPLLLLAGWKTQALERNCHPRYVSLRSNFAARVPNRIERRIPVPHLGAGRFGPDRVPLHSQRSCLERVSASPVVKRVEHNLDVIVIVDIFAARHASANLLRIVEANKHYVEIFLVVTEISFGRLGNLFAIVRVTLREASYPGHLQRHFSLGLHAEEILDRWSASQPRDGQSRRSERGRGQYGSDLVLGLGDYRQRRRGHDWILSRCFCVRSRGVLPGVLSGCAVLTARRAILRLYLRLRPRCARPRRREQNQHKNQRKLHQPLERNPLSSTQTQRSLTGPRPPERGSQKDTLRAHITKQ